MIRYSVLISVYHKEQPEFLRQAIDSMYAQTVLPDEVVLVCDGPLNDPLDQVIRSFQERYPESFRVLRLEHNWGLGGALHQGVCCCKNEWIARMDSDDISLPDRMEKQLAFLEAHPEVSVVGGQIIEFDEDPSKPLDMRCVPEDMEHIQKTLRLRNPMNHVTTVFRRADVLAVGNYEDRYRFEDYHLWVKLISSGYQMANIPQCCCYVRAGADAFQRRGGYAYFRQALALQMDMRKAGLISIAEFIRNAAVWFAASVVLPSGLRGFLFKKFMRTDVPALQEKKGEAV